MIAMGPDEILELISHGATTRLDNPAFASRFEIGDHVHVHNINPTTHTRAPRYVRGKTGVIHRVNGVFAFPDTNAVGRGPESQYVYTVCFDSEEIWGPQAVSGDKFLIEMWEDYLNPA